MEKETGSLICTLVATQHGVVDDTYALCCNVLAIGSSRSNDIILKDAVNHHAVLQANSLGEVFLFHHDSKLRTGHYLGHNDTFTVGAKLFKLKYPQDTDLNHPIATDGTSATIRGRKVDQCPVTPESSKPCLTEDPTDYSESSVTVTRDTDLNHPKATDGTSATIRGGKEDQSPVTPESSKPCLTEVPTDYPESSATVTREIEDDFEGVFDEDLYNSISNPESEMTDSGIDLDDSVNDPDFEMADSDVQSSDEFDDNDQAQGRDNDYVSDSSDQSDIIPCVKSLPALQINKVTSSTPQLMDHDIALDEEVSSDDEYDDNVLMDDPESVHNETDDPESVHNETDDSELVQDEMDDPELLRVSKSKPTSKRPALEMTCNLLAKRARNQVKAKESCPGTSSSGNPTSRKSSNSPKKARRIQNLTDEQRRCLRSLFQVNVTMRQELQMIDCINAIQRHKCLSSLDWTKIKNTVHNWITGEKRKMKQISKYNLS